MDPELVSSEMDTLLAKAEPNKEGGAAQPRCCSSRLSPNKHFCDLCAAWGEVGRGGECSKEIQYCQKGNWCYDLLLEWPRFLLTNSLRLIRVKRHWMIDVCKYMYIYNIYFRICLHAQPANFNVMERMCVAILVIIICHNMTMWKHTDIT